MILSKHGILYSERSYQCPVMIMYFFLLILDRMPQELFWHESEFGKMCTSWNKWHIRKGKWGEITRRDESIIPSFNIPLIFYSPCYSSCKFCTADNAVINNCVIYHVTLLWYRRYSYTTRRKKRKDLVSFIDIGKDIIKHQVISGI